MKTCTRCRQAKVETEFHRNRNSPDGLRSDCKDCACAYQRQQYEHDPVHPVGEIELECQQCRRVFRYTRTTGRLRMYCSDDCKTTALEGARKARGVVLPRACECGSTNVARVGVPVCPSCRKDKRNPESARAKERRRTLQKYGITEADWDRMLGAQGGRCAICRTDTPGGRGERWSVDHDHVSGNVRGLLCSGCNAGIGLLRDDPRVIRSAAAYVEQHRQLRLVS